VLHTCPDRGDAFYIGKLIEDMGRLIPAHNVLNFLRVAYLRPDLNIQCRVNGMQSGNPVAHIPVRANNNNGHDILLLKPGVRAQV
jgi:hypothetical protein